MKIMSSEDLKSFHSLSFSLEGSDYSHRWMLLHAHTSATVTALGQQCPTGTNLDAHAVQSWCDCNHMSRSVEQSAMTTNTGQTITFIISITNAECQKSQNVFQDPMQLATAQGNGHA